MSSSILRLPDRTLAEINITPLVDVLLVLLVIFMITAPVVTGKISLPLAGDKTDPAEPAVLELSIAGDGQVTNAAGIVLSPLEVRAEMVNYAGKPGLVSLTLRPSADTTHQRMIDLLSMARESQLTNIAIQRPN
jgi:biopolymer transport protein ExbD